MSSLPPIRLLQVTGLQADSHPSPKACILSAGDPSSKGASAVTAVIARSRWVLTGTPIINSLKDLYSLLRFIGITGGMEKLEVFNSVLVRPIKANDSSATALLQAIMSAFCLRRRKEMKFIDLKLPELSEFVHRVQFADKEKERYMALFQEAQGTLSSYRKVEGQKASETYRYLLEVCCCVSPATVEYPLTRLPRFFFVSVKSATIGRCVLSV